LRREVDHLGKARDQELAAAAAVYAETEAGKVRALAGAVHRAWAATDSRQDYRAWLAGLLPAPTEVEVRELREVLVRGLG
jgi:hypothetical protein